MQKLDQFYIDGAWVQSISSQTMPILNPATNTQIGTLTLGNKEDVNRAVTAAKTAFETYAMTPKVERIALLYRLLDISRERQEELAQAISTEMGAPITMARNAQADCAIGHLEGFIKALESQEESEELENGDILSREPIGVCGLITPWNWPINQIALKVIPALAVGSTCILKPSEHTPLSARIYAQMIHDAGFPAGVFNMVYGDGPTVGSALSKHKDIAMMSFTGSTRAGTIVTKEAADTLKRVTLELGGKSPNVIFADCDLSKAIENGVNSCFYNTGQSCNAPTRMLIERSCYDKALVLAKAAAEAQKVGDPKQEGDHIGPLFDEIQYKRVQTLIKAGIDEGATLLTGGIGKPEGFEAGWFVKPTIFADVHNQMRIAREEVFGPVLVMIPFENEEQAIHIANDTNYGLDAYVYTGNKARALRVTRRLHAGGIHINGVGTDYGSPFGGYKQSGNGREGGIWGLEDYQEIKVRPKIDW